MKYYLYILYSSSSNKYYVGYSADVQKRVEQHNNSVHKTFTAKHRPWVLKAVFYAGETRAKAMQIEKRVKKLKSRVIIEKLINPDFVPDGELEALVRVPILRD